MKKIKNVKSYVAVALVVLWVGVIAYFVATGDGSMFKGQAYPTAMTCDQILVEMNNPQASNVSALVDAATEKDCSVSPDLLQKLAPKIMEEQKGSL